MDDLPERGDELRPEHLSQPRAWTAQTHQPMPAFDPNRVRHHPLPAWTSHSFHAHAVDLSVDSITGEVSINRYVVAQDVGYAINPTYIEGQIEGGVAQGIGQTLSEE